VVVIVLVFNAFLIWLTGSQLEPRLLTLRREGYPIQLADLAREPIPTEKNADAYLIRAHIDLEAIQKELLVLYPRKGYATGKFSADERSRLETLFSKYPSVVPLLEQASNCPDSGLQLNFRLPTTQFLQPYMDRTSHHRVLNRVLRTRSSLLLSEGRGDDALANQLVLLRLTRLWRREPLIFAYLVTAVCELGAMEGVNDVLQAGPVSPSARQALDAELALHDTLEGYDTALVTERAYALTSFREIPGAGFWLVRGFQNRLAISLIDLIDCYRQKRSRPYVSVVGDSKAAPSLTGGMNLYGSLITLLEPALIALREPAERTRAMSRAVRVLSALQQRGSIPGEPLPTLTELGLPEAVTVDPFNSKPLCVKKHAAGWMVYSVGANLVDDGGILDSKTDIGAGPAKQ
jgi:hypothetical protein